MSSPRCWRSSAGRVQPTRSPHSPRRRRGGAAQDDARVEPASPDAGRVHPGPAGARLVARRSPRVGRHAGSPLLAALAGPDRRRRGVGSPPFVPGLTDRASSPAFAERAPTPAFAERSPSSPALTDRASSPALTDRGSSPALPDRPSAPARSEQVSSSGTLGRALSTGTLGVVARNATAPSLTARAEAEHTCGARSCSR